MYQILQPSKQDQRAVIQFLGAEGCQPVEIYHRMQAVYGNACVSKTTVNDWSRQFRQGRQSTSDMARPGRSRVATSPANVAAVEAALRSNRNLSMKAIAANLHISVGSVHSIIQNLGTVNHMKKKGRPNLCKQKDTEEIEIPSKATKVEPLFEVMIKHEPVDEGFSYSDSALPEADVKHEPLDEALPQPECTLYVTPMKHEAEDTTTV